MSQNFSKMSDIYIPELIELDSYWQKAVEDAIYDTLKGEKRLYYALRNRKKINEKLAKLGLKPLYSQMSFSGGCRLSVPSFDSTRDAHLSANRCKSTAQTEWGSCEGDSTTESRASIRHDEASSWQRAPPADPSSPSSMSRLDTKSASKDRRETPPEKMYRNPERPILGNGSLEKMKKSQNSFYCEPMGTGEVAAAEGRQRFGGGKKVEWLHFRNNDAFQDSDTETSNHEPAGREIPAGDRIGSTQAAPRKSTQRRLSRPKSRRGRVRKHLVPMTLDPKEDSFWEKEVKSAIRKNAGHERKLHFALAKREIVNESLRKMNVEEDDKEIMISKPDARTTIKKRQSKKLLSPYIRFYLEVYRELCHEAPMKRIAEEAAARWWQKSLATKICR